MLVAELMLPGLRADPEGEDGLWGFSLRKPGPGFWLESTNSQAMTSPAQPGSLCMSGSQQSANWLSVHGNCPG